MSTAGKLEWIEVFRSLEVNSASKPRDYFQQVASMDSRVAEDLQEEIVDWTFGELPEVMEIRRKGVSLIGHPAIADRGDYCSIEVFDEPEEAKKFIKRHQKTYPFPA